MLKHPKTIILSAVIIATVAGAGYYFENRQANASAANEETMQGPPATPVAIELVDAKPVQIWKDYSARLEAVEFAEIRPQVSGRIAEIRFKDGQDIEQGDVIYVIDPRPYKAAVNQTQAELNAARNQASLTKKELSRAEELIKTNAISERILDERNSAHKVAAASVQAAQARLDMAKINLDYAYVKAPISGRLGRAEIKVGNLVEAGSNAPMLTSIVSTQGIYADFEVDEQTYLKYIRSAAQDRDAENQIPVQLSLSGDSQHYDGFIYSFDNQIDVTSGTIRARAMFANEDATLLPGMFANVKMGTPLVQTEILVDERAISTDQDRKFVYVVNDQAMAEYREVRIGNAQNGKRIITSGLESGDRVITSGLMKLRPGMPVKDQADMPQQAIQKK